MHLRTVLDLSVIFDAFSNWFAVIILWLKDTYIRVWTFSFSLYDILVVGLMFWLFFWAVTRFWLDDDSDFASELEIARGDNDFDDLF